jgi:hypothetical protein
MTKDFSQYQKIIDHFRGQVANSDFEAKFNAVTKKVEYKERFLLKMEIKRLAIPCTRLIDLRGLVDGECRVFEYKSETHFLDPIAIGVFEESVKLFGEYTFGVYEAVSNTENNFRVMYAKEKKQLKVEPSAAKSDQIVDKNQYPGELFRFDQFYDRCEERMNFVVAVQVHLSPESELDAMTSDLSVSGCKFRFQEQQSLKLGQIIQLRFIGLEQEFQLRGDNTFSYQIQNIHQDESTQVVGVQRIGDAAQENFIKFLSGFILGNKRRYKINLDNSISALKSRSLEQFTLPKANEFPIFIEESNGKVLPRYVLTTNNNQAHVKYWQDEKGGTTLHCLINEDRLIKLKKAAQTGQSLLVYSFVHINQGKSYFYSADHQQLSADKAFMERFLGFCASKNSFAITQLSFLELEASRAHFPFTLANTLTAKDKYINLSPSVEVIDVLAQLSCIVVANNITDLQLVKDYRRLSFENININQLKGFGHQRLRQSRAVEALGINYRHQRQELRFKYKTPVIVDINQEQHSAKSHDFSMSGLMIETENTVALKKGDIVKINFPKLQKITSNFELKGLPYEVMSVHQNKKIIYLCIFVEKHQHIGRTFFKLLIEKNRNKLTPDEYEMKLPGLGKALRNIYAHSLSFPTVIIKSSGSSYKFDTLVGNNEDGNLLSLMHEFSKRPQFYNLYPLLSNSQVQTNLNDHLKKMSGEDKPYTQILYIALKSPLNKADKFDKIEQLMITKLDNEFASAEDKMNFIGDAINNGRFFCIQAQLSRVDEPDMDYLNPELSYISSYAIHRAKQIEQEIFSTTGMIQLIDITNEARLRFELWAQ